MSDEGQQIEDDKPVPTVKVRSAESVHPLLKFVGAPMVAVAMGWLAFNYFMDTDKGNREFITTTLISKLDKFTESATRADESNKMMIAKVDRMIEELDDWTKAILNLVARINILIDRVWQDQRPETP
jgi:hypothetical protein